jgi:hypothetical protein
MKKFNDDHLDSPKTCLSDKHEIVNGICKHAVKPGPFDHWYITMGHPGYNSPANNRNGYKTKVSAASACHRYGRR